MTPAIEALADLIGRHYLFADRADSLARQVEDWATGPIAELQSAEELATAMTERLQEATNDGHFRVMDKVFTPEELAAAPEDRWKHSMPGAASNFGFRSVEVNNGTALITLNSVRKRHRPERSDRRALLSGQESVDELSDVIDGRGRL